MFGRVSRLKKLYIVMLALVAFSAHSGANRAQERKAVDKASPKLFLGKVTQVDERTKAVTMQDKDGEKITINFSNARTGTCPAGRKAVAWTSLPKVGSCSSHGTAVTVTTALRPAEAAA